MSSSDLVKSLAAAQGVTNPTPRSWSTGCSPPSATPRRGEEISLNGFGKFKVMATPARDGHNPATGEPITIKAAKKLTFTPAKAVKDKLNG